MFIALLEFSFGHQVQLWYIVFVVTDASPVAVASSISTSSSSCSSISLLFSFSPPLLFFHPYFSLFLTFFLHFFPSFLFFRHSFLLFFLHLFSSLFLYLLLSFPSYPSQLTIAAPVVVCGQLYTNRALECSGAFWLFKAAGHYKPPVSFPVALRCLRPQ